MKTVLSLSLILFFSIPSFSQFVKEAEYPSSQVLRVLLQDQSERYLYVDLENTLIKIADENHQVIDSLPAPECEGTLSITKARNDFEETEMGVLCTCFTYSDMDGANFDYHLLDIDGNTMLDINSSAMDDRYIIKFEDFQSTIYNTQSLDVISVKPQLRIIPSNPNYHDDRFYFGYNGIDSIFIYDETLSTIKSIEWEFNDSENTIRFSAASKLEDGQPEFYFVISESDPNTAGNIYNRLISEDGSILAEFEDNNVTFHKFEQDLIIIYFSQQGIKSYNIQTDEFNTLSNNSGITSIVSTGKYPAIKYIPQTGFAEFYDNNFELSNLVEIEKNLNTFLRVFNDHHGNEYFWYTPFFDASYTAIYKENIFLQQIVNSKRMTPSNIENLPTKLLSESSVQDELTEVYSLTTTSTQDLSASIFSLSPNPVRNELSISTKEKFESYVIIDNTGKVVSHKLLFANDFTIDASELEAGIYFIRLQSSNNQTTPEKFVKL